MIFLNFGFFEELSGYCVPFLQKAIKKFSFGLIGKSVIKRKFEFFLRAVFLEPFHIFKFFIKSVRD